MTKKIITILTILTIFFSILSNKAYSATQKKYFRVTAYYSPLPNQTHYIKWDYVREIRMNWRWIRWASGKKVFSWMLAAPSIYSFGTKIKLKWLGIAEVADRWGAIVKAWERSFKHDRIDIWCGYWEEGLQRAMFWWNRVIEWEIVPRNSKVNLNIKNIPAPKWTIYHAIKNPDFIKTWSVKNEIYLSSKVQKNNQTKIKDDIFNWPIKNSEQVKILQEKLIEMDLYSKEIDWNYSSIKEIILKFQLDNNVISKDTDIWAGNFWPKTRKTFKEKYTSFIKKKEEEKLRKIELEKKEKKARLEATNRINNIWKIKFWDISYDVRVCQKILNEVWYFKYKDTAIFWEKTRQSIINYQLDKKLIENENIYWAGIFWPKTRKSLIEDLTKKSLEK